MRNLIKTFTVIFAIPFGLVGAYLTSPRFDVVRESQPKVVKIGVVPNSGEGRFVGSGAIVSPDGAILTCAHLFGKPGKVFVKTASGQTYLAHIVRVNHKVDLAVVKIDAVDPLPYFRLGREPKIGQFVMAFGSPLDIQGTVSFGYVENLNDGPSKFTIQGCPTNPGNSGGPLVDQNGRIVGVNVAILLMNPFQVAEGLSLAVNLETIREFVRS